jgi:hypothetical protein
VVKASHIIGMAWTLLLIYEAGEIRRLGSFWLPNLNQRGHRNIPFDAYQGYTVLFVDSVCLKSVTAIDHVPFRQEWGKVSTITNCIRKWYVCSSPLTRDRPLKILSRSSVLSLSFWYAYYRAAQTNTDCRLGFALANVIVSEIVPVCFHM